MDLTKTIENRKSTKKFSTKEPKWRDIIACIDVTRYAPMAGNNYSLRFIIVDDKNIIDKLAEAAEQPFIRQAHYVVVAVTNPLKTVNAYEERGRAFLRQQAGAAIQNFLLKIEEKKLATCWIGYFVEYLVKEALKIPDNINVEAMFPIGYEAEKPKTRKLKIELDKILFFNKYGERRMGKENSINA